MSTSAELLHSGALKTRCTESADGLKCVECGNTSHNSADWKKNHDQCPICEAGSPQHTCRRCGGGFSDPVSKAEHACRSVDVFEKSGHVAFPEAAPKPAGGARHIPKGEHHRHSAVPKPGRPGGPAHSAAPPAMPGSSAAESLLTRVLNYVDRPFLESTVKFALLATLTLIIERMLFAAWFSSGWGVISTESPQFGQPLTLLMTAVFLLSLWFFLPFKQATLVAVLVALLIEFIMGIAGQCIVNVDGLLAGESQIQGILVRGLMWGMSGGILTFGMRYAEKCFEEDRLFLSLGWMFSSAFLIYRFIY